MGTTEHAWKTLMNLFVWLFVRSHLPCVDTRQFLTNTFGKHTQFADKCSFSVHALYVYLALHHTKNSFNISSKNHFSREIGEGMQNVKKLFHKQGKYEESCAIGYSHFTFFFKFLHLFYGSSHIMYSWH